MQNLFFPQYVTKALINFSEGCNQSFQYSDKPKIILNEKVAESLPWFVDINLLSQKTQIPVSQLKLYEKNPISLRCTPEDLLKIGNVLIALFWNKNFLEQHNEPI